LVRAARAPLLALVVLAARAPEVRAADAADTTQAADSSRGTWAEARGLADGGRYDEALAVIRRGLQRSPDDIDLRWLEAGVTGWAGRHEQAVRLYEGLVAQHPELVREVRTDLATERLWAGDPHGALRDLNVRLVEEPTDHDARVMRALALSHADRLSESLAAYDSLLTESPGDPDLELERARVLNWMGRNREAVRAYRDELARDPNDRGAQLGLARVENWSGLHRRAAARLAPLAQAPDVEPEVLKTLAYACYWSGDPGRARDWLDLYLAREPHDREGLELQDQLARELSPGLTGGVARSDDSDGLRIRTTTMELSLPIGRRNTATLGWQRDNVSDAGGTVDPLQYRGGLQTIWSAACVTRATFAVCDLGSSGGTSGEGELALTVRPDDRTRIDAGVSRDLIMTRLALTGGVAARTFVGGIDWSPAERFTLHADARQRFYSDDNRSQAEAAWARIQAYSDRTRKLALSVRGEQLRTRRDLDNGYYDPAQYQEWGPGAEMEWTPSPGVTISGNGWTGWQRERDAETRPFVNVSGRAEWTIRNLATLAIEGGRSNSNLQTTSGYERKQWAVSVTKGF
jgi:tetratricopeptide (TPR) repeat protein